MFKDRAEAGKLLAQAIPTLKNSVVLAIPRGGVEIGRVIADHLNAPLDVVVARKLGAPGNPELAIGAVTSDGTLYLDNNLVQKTGADKNYLEKVIAKEQKEAQRREKVFRRERKPVPLENKDIVIVDDGIATGATTFAVIKKLKNKGRSLILAVPVMPAELVNDFKKNVDKLIYLQAPVYFVAVGMYYNKFPQLSYQDVIDLLKNSRE